jgi:hypothetical protein
MLGLWTILETMLAAQEDIRKTMLAVQALTSDIVQERNNRRNNAFWAEVSENSSNNSKGETFRQQLVKYYGNGTEVSPGNFHSVRCMVSHETFQGRKDWRAGHILPRKCGIWIADFGIAADDINSPRNGIIWATGIEKEFNPAEKVCFLYDLLHHTLKFKVLDKKLLNKNVEGIKKSFGEINGNSLLIPGGGEAFPFLRLIWQHSVAAISKSFERGNISEEERPLFESYLKDSKTWLADI